MRRIVVATTIAVALLAWSASPAPAVIRGGSGTALLGSEEVPPADPDGFGVAVATFDPDRNLVCYFLAVFNIAPSTAAHIHSGARGTNGPVVVDFVPPTDGTSAGCATPRNTSVIPQLLANPSAFYVNVHNAVYPGGAVRGQLR